jgi:hypothetical protein
MTGPAQRQGRTSRSDRRRRRTGNGARRILREGLGYDQADIGAVLNISADHLGLKGIETV